MQGLRRSGTTILFDILSQDRRLKLYYEPFSAGKKTMGGGSGVQKKDLTLSLRNFRDNFCKNHNVKNTSFSNRGAPRNFKLEVFNDKLTDLEKKYISELSNNKNVCLKFTRATFIIEELFNIDKSGSFIHVEKDAKQWVMSHIFAKNYKNKSLRNPDIFFGKDINFNFWSQENIANRFIKLTNPKLLSEPGYIKLLYIWSSFNSKIENDGKNFFKKNYFKVKNSDLYFNLDNTIEKLYDHINIPLSSKALFWARENVRKPREVIFDHDKRWEEGFFRANIKF